MKETMDALLPAPRFIHVKDTEHAQGKRGFLLPGEGTIDYVQMFKLLRPIDLSRRCGRRGQQPGLQQPGYEPLSRRQQVLQSPRRRVFRVRPETRLTSRLSPDS